MSSDEEQTKHKQRRASAANERDEATPTSDSDDEVEDVDENTEQSHATDDKAETDTITDLDAQWDTVERFAITPSAESVIYLDKTYGDEIEKYESEMGGGVLYENRTRYVDKDATHACAALRESSHTRADTFIPRPAWESDAAFVWKIHFSALCMHVWCSGILFVYVSTAQANPLWLVINAMLLIIAATHLNAIMPFGNQFLRKTYANGYAKGLSCGSALRMFLRMNVASLSCAMLFNVVNVSQTLLFMCLSAAISYMWSYAADKRVSNFCSVMRSFSSTYSHMIIHSDREENRQYVVNDPRQHNQGLDTQTCDGKRVYSPCSDVPTSYSAARCFSVTLMTGMRVLRVYPSQVRSIESAHDLRTYWREKLMSPLLSLCSYPDTEGRAGAFVYFAYALALFSYLSSADTGSIGCSWYTLTSFATVQIVCALAIPLCALSMLVYSRTAGMMLETRNSVRMFVKKRLVISEGLADCLMLIALSTLLYTGSPGT